MRRMPLSRGNSSVSARDSTYWLAVASASSCSVASSTSAIAAVRSLASSASSPSLTIPNMTTAAVKVPMRKHTDPSLLLSASSYGSAPLDAKHQMIVPVPQKKLTQPNVRQTLSTSPLLCDDSLMPRNPLVVSPSARRDARAEDIEFDSSGSATLMTSGASVTFADQKPGSSQTTPQHPRRQDRGKEACPIVAEEVYENQRYQMVLGWGSKGHLLPLDPGKYMRAIRRPRAGGLARAAIRIKSRRRRSLGDFAFRNSHPTAMELLDAFTQEEDEDADGLGGDDADNCDIEWAHSSIFPDITLPEGVTTTEDGAEVNARWEWISPWHLEFPCHYVRDGDNFPPPPDPDGWQYSTSFQNFTRTTNLDGNTQQQQLQQRRRAHSSPCHSPTVHSSWRPKHYVRCRKWVRYRRLRPESFVGTPEAPDANAFDDSFLDSMRGWLRKLGHVRKNWKSRYFVLERSVLRYYSDDSMTRLKGEVLLFHPATRVHYVDIHLSGGRDCTFAIQVGKDYTLLLQADQLSVRENWMYCIEDALLCRDSYYEDPEQARDLRESVALRRKLSSESMVLGNGLGMHHHPLNVLIVDSKTQVKKATQDANLLQLLSECEAFLGSMHMKSLIQSFLQKFKQKYAMVAVPTAANSPHARKSSVGTQRESESYSLSSPTVDVLHDARSLLALKNYRFFIERTLESVIEYLAQLPSVTGSPITSPKGWKPARMGYAKQQTPPPPKPTVSDEAWQLVRKAALYKLERLTFIPLQDVIYNLLETTIFPDDLEDFERNRKHLGAQSQAFFEISASHTSSSQWKSATALLSTIDNYSLPCEKSSVLLEVAKCIYETHANEHDQVSVQMMAADDFLPIFICILSRCQLRNVVITRHLISETMISAMMIGETGYYATMLEAAVGYIASFDVAAEQGESPQFDCELDDSGHYPISR
uniref:VPS9 domain-containing protein n=1 Tax=Globisporangium ultimum (strain ATCC 200006 / CBS 805.95 / DAOM BR144) TaxID=431595 RepID=K3WR45_GLOUD